MGVTISHMLEGLWNRDTKSTSAILIFVHVLVPRVKFSWFLLAIVLVYDLLVRVKRGIGIPLTILKRIDVLRNIIEFMLD